MSYKRSILLTGGTHGLGYEAALKLAKDHPDYLIVVASRSDKEKAAERINQRLGQSNTQWMKLDLSDPDSVRRFAQQWISDASKPPLQVLMFNAGLQFPTTLTLTPEGMEKTFAIAHVGHAMLFHLLYPQLATGGRVVLTSSGTHDPAQKSGLPDAEYNTAQDLAYPPKSMVDIPGRKRYSTAKLCNVLWGYALAKRLAERAPERRITVTSMDPGLMPGTDLAREASKIEKFLWYHVLPRTIGLLRLLVHPNVHSPAESGAALARLATGSDVEGITGKYFESLREIKSSEDSYNIAKQDDLWDWTVNYVAQGDAAEKARLNSLKL
ncbi:hypothetical protein V2G26_000425 [Clonostachys chloroleuca]